MKADFYRQNFNFKGAIRSFYEYYLIKMLIIK